MHVQSAAVRTPPVAAHSSRYTSGRMYQNAPPSGAKATAAGARDGRLCPYNTKSFHEFLLFLSLSLAAPVLPHSSSYFVKSKFGCGHFLSLMETKTFVRSIQHTRLLAFCFFSWFQYSHLSPQSLFQPLCKNKQRQKFSPSAHRATSMAPAAAGRWLLQRGRGRWRWRRRLGPPVMRKHAVVDDAFHASHPPLLL